MDVEFGHLLTKTYKHYVVFIRQDISAVLFLWDYISTQFLVDVFSMPNLA